MKDSFFEIRSIIEELYDEFLKEEVRLNDICSGNTVRIDELEHKIITLRKNEDVDFRVFSPRNVSPANSEKILELENEKENLERESRESSKQLKYYSERTRKLGNALELLNAGVSIPQEVVEVDNSNTSVDEDPFAELFPAHKKLGEFSSKNVEETVEEVEETPSEVVEETKKEVKKEDTVAKSSIARIIHKAEFTERIMANDSIRARLELKEVIKQLKELL